MTLSATLSGKGGDGRGTLEAIPAVAMAKRHPLSPLLKWPGWW